MRQVKRRGDTLIEVMLSISIFAMVALVTINMMNGGINTAQRTLEYEMARNEIDAQAEALRFVHNSYVSELQKAKGKGQFGNIWDTITKRAVKPSTITNGSFDINNMDSCDDAYGGDTQRHLNKYKAFVLNPRLMVPKLSDSFTYLEQGYSDLMKNMVVNYNASDGIMNSPSLYPRIVYKKLKEDSGTCQNADCDRLDEGGALYNAIGSAEGIWLNAVGNNGYSVSNSDYFDFYIRTCWHSTGSNAPSTITMVVRLYNPGAIK